MRPYYQDEYTTLYHADCRELADQFQTTDIMVTDPPYGMRYSSNYRTKKHNPITGDNDTTLRDWIINQWGKVKPALVFGTWKQPRPPETRAVIVWEKGQTTGGIGDLTIPWKGNWEEIYVLGKWPGNTGRGTGVLHVDAGPPTPRNRPDHPTPKPVPLMEALISKCPPGTILDPCAGSGATLRAAKNQGRHAIGIEIVEKYCEMAAKQLAQEVLFH